MRGISQIIGFILLTNHVVGQGYLHLLRPDVEWWTVETFDYLPTWTYKYKINGTDTFFNGHTYRPLNSVYLREDTLSGKVYKVDFSDSSEIVFYDFSLVMGDSALSKVVADSELVFVTDISTVNIGGELRKQITFSPPGDSPLCNDRWIEGVGSIFGPLGPEVYIYDCWHYEAYLTCYRDTNTTLYGDCTPIGIGEIGSQPLDAPNIKIWPNPVSDVLHINASEKIFHVDIRDATGRKMKCNADAWGNVNTSGLAEGLYFAQIKTLSAIHSYSFITVHE